MSWFIYSDHGTLSHKNPKGSQFDFGITSFKTKEAATEMAKKLIKHGYKNVEIIRTKRNEIEERIQVK
jgi:hypothetical protein